MIFDQDGRFKGSWGEGQFARAHGITIDPDDAVYITDDLDHTIKKFTPDGTLLMMIGKSGNPSTPGLQARISDDSTRRCSVSLPDQCGTRPRTARCILRTDMGMHQSAQVLQRWPASVCRGGEPCHGARSEFHIPHGIAVGPDGTVVVADRENSRLQFFSPHGQFLREWTEIARPCQVAIDARGIVYVAELGYKAAMWPGTTAPYPDATGGRVSIFDPAGEL